MYLTPDRMAIIRKKITSVGKDVAEREPFFIMENSMEIP